MYVLTRQGLTLARRIEAALDARLYVSDSLSDSAVEHLFEESGPAKRAHRPLCRFSRLSDLLRECFDKHACHIFITAAGIAVRCVAPLLKGKSLDPAVLVLDQRGRFVISLLSGHLGGGNAMAVAVADILGAAPVITTATDVEDLPALDVLAKDKGLAIVNPGAIKAVSAALLDGGTVALHDPDDCLGIRESRWAALFRNEPDIRRALEPDDRHTLESDDHHALEPDDRPDGAALLPPARVIVTERAAHQLAPPEGGPALPAGWLFLHPRRLFLGIGCRKDTPEQDILRHIRAVLASAGLAPEAVAGLASLDAKQEETGLLRAAKTLGLPLRFFTPAELAGYPVSAPSPKAMERFGIAGVCEPAALAAAGKGARLLITKTAETNVTLAVARADAAQRGAGAGMPPAAQGVSPLGEPHRGSAPGPRRGE